MLFKKSVRAAVLSKGKEEAEDPPLLGAFGGNSILALTAMTDENKTMWKRSTVYTVSFITDRQTMEFFVERNIYDTLKTGEEGTLCYSGDAFISFSKDNN